MPESEKIKIRPLDYLKDIEDLKLVKPELLLIKKQLLDKLEIIKVPVESIFQEADEYNIELEKYWKEYGQNYDIVPELAKVPYFQKAFVKYIRITHEEKLIILNEFLNALKIVDNMRQEVKKEKKLKKFDEMNTIEKAWDELEQKNG